MEGGTERGDENSVSKSIDSQGQIKMLNEVGHIWDGLRQEQNRKQLSETLICLETDYRPVQGDIRQSLGSPTIKAMFLPIAPVTINQRSKN